MIINFYVCEAEKGCDLDKGESYCDATGALGFIFGFSLDVSSPLCVSA